MVCSITLVQRRRQGGGLGCYPNLPLKTRAQLAELGVPEFQLAQMLVRKHVAHSLGSLDAPQLTAAVAGRADLFVTADRKRARAGVAESLKVSAFLPQS